MADRQFLSGEDILKGLNASDIMNIKSYQDERWLNKMSFTYDEFSKSVARSQLQAGSNLGSFMEGIGGKLRVSEEDKKFIKRDEQDDIDLGYIDKTGQLMQRTGNSISTFLNKLGSLEGLQPSEKISQGTFMENPSFARAVSIAGGAISSISNGYVLTALTGSPMLTATMFGAQTGGGLYAEAKEAGQTEDEAFKSLAQGATTTAVLERALGPFGREIAGAGFGTIATNVVRGGGREGMTEGLQQLSENFIRKTNINAEAELFEGVAESIIVGSITGGAISGISTGAIQRQERNRQRMLDAGITEEQLDIYTEEVANSLVKNKEQIDAEFTKNIENSLSQLDNYTPTELESASKVKQFIVEQATTAGVEQDLAEGVGQLYEARSLASSRALEITPEEWIRSWNLSIEGKNQEFSQVEQDKYNNLTQEQKEYFASDDYKRNVKVGELFQDNIVDFSSVDKIKEELESKGYNLRDDSYTIVDSLAELEKRNYIDKQVKLLAKDREAREEFLFKDFIQEKADSLGVSYDEFLDNPKYYEEYINESAVEERAEDFSSEIELFDVEENIARVTKAQGNYILDVFKSKGYDTSLFEFEKSGQSASRYIEVPTEVDEDGDVLDFATIRISDHWGKYEGDFNIDSSLGQKDVDFVIDNIIKEYGDDIPKLDVNMLQQSKGKKGSIQFGEGQTIINLFENADKSTILHETGHLFLRDISRVANLSDNQVIQEDYKTLNKWLGSKDGVYTRKQEEKFARGFEQYLREGKAPSNKLKDVFDKFRNWLTSVYQSAQDLNVSLTDEVRQVLDRSIASQEEIDLIRSDEATKQIEQELFQEEINADRIREIIEPLEFNRKEELLEELFQSEDVNKRSYVVNEINNQIKMSAIEKAVVSSRPTITDEQIDSDLKAVRNDKKQTATQLLKNKGLTYQNVDSLTSKLFVPLSTRLNNINSKLKHTLKQFEFSKGKRVAEDMKKAEKFIKLSKSMDPADFRELDLALKNGLTEVRDRILKQYNMSEAFAEVELLIQDITNRAKTVGMEFGEIPNYFPREVEDADAYITYLQGTDKWTNIERSLRIADPDNTLSSLDKATFINGMVNRYDLREQQQELLKRTKHTESRTITYVNAEANTFYKDSIQALIGYVDGMNNTIEAKRFWGLDMQDFENSLGGTVNEMIENNELTRQQEIEFKKIIRARFNPASPRGFIRAYKNSAYIYTMGQFTSAITQIGDLGLSLYKNGYYNTGAALFKKKKITREDLGIENIAQEFMDSGTSAEAVKNVFKIVGLSKFDEVFKNVNINASLMDLQKKSKQNKESAGYKQVKQLAIEAFDTKYEKVLKDLQEGNITTDVKYLTFSQLTDLQPLNLTEMPEMYVTGGNARLFYMLKSYTIKLIDIYNNDIFKKMRTDPKQAMTNAIRLSAALMLTGATADTLKDLMLGRELKIDDLVADNILKLFGISKFQIYSSQRDGIGATAFRTILPPIPFADDIYMDLKGKKDIEDWRIWGRVPVVGKEYYWWFGGGEDIRNKE